MSRDVVGELRRGGSGGEVSANSQRDRDGWRRGDGGVVVQHELQGVAVAYVEWFGEQCAHAGTEPPILGLLGLVALREQPDRHGTRCVEHLEAAGDCAGGGRFVDDLDATTQRFGSPAIARRGPRRVEPVAAHVEHPAGACRVEHGLRDE